MRARALGVLGTALGLALAALPHTALAGPVEVLEGMTISPTDPDAIVIRYKYAGGGFLISHDGGTTFSFVCNSAISASVVREASALSVGSDGTILLGVFDGMWQGDANGCGWSSSTTFAGQWVNDFAVDPQDATRTYAVTSAGGKQNGLYVNEAGSDAWKAVGAQKEILINRLHVVALPGGKTRIYESVVDGERVTPAADGGTDSLPNYVIRVSDDLGKTWVEHEFGETDGTVRLVAVDPTDPERIVVAVLRDEFGGEPLPDDLLVSATQGKPGSFKKLGTVSELGGATFAPDGRFFYGDHHQSTPGLYGVASLDAKPKQLSSKYKVGCLTYDARTDKLYVCQDTLFGTASPDDGTFTLLYDIKRAASFASCPGEDPLAARCEAQLIGGYCGVTHYPCTPICADYGVEGFDGKPAVDACDAGVAADAGASQDAGASGSGGADAKDAGSSKPTDSSSCAVATPGAERGASKLAAFALFGLALWVSARRRRAR